MTLLGTVSTGLAGGVFGLAIAAPPGPMNAVIAEESVLRGWKSGFFAGLGAMTADACFFVLALVGAVTFVERYPAARAAMVAVGGVLMLYFAYDAARNARNSFTDEIEDSRGFRKAFVLALTNPYQIVFWLTVGVGLLEPGRIDVLAGLPAVGDSLTGVLVVATGSPALLVGFFAGIALWVTGYPAAMVAAQRRASAVRPVIAYASALVLAGFGVVFLADGLTTLGSAAIAVSGVAIG